MVIIGYDTFRIQLLHIQAKNAFKILSVLIVIQVL